jgi:serine/threonine protein kinase
LNPNRLPDFDQTNSLFPPRSQGGKAADRTSYLVFPLLPGGNLRRDLNLLKEQQRTPSSIGCLKLLLQLLQAVEHLCKHNVLHLDLKPDNILFEKGDLDNHEELVEKFAFSMQLKTFFWTSNEEQRKTVQLFTSFFW